MFEIRRGSDGRFVLSGRFDARSAGEVRDFLAGVAESCTVDCRDLDYISSAGLGVLLGVQRRLADDGGRVRLVNLNRNIKNLLEVAGFDRVFEIG